MPTFFSPNNLTADQRDRWPWAVAEYERIQEENFRREMELVPVEQRTTKTVSDLRTMHQLLGGGGAGHSKSALFWRLLSGKKALPYPPPTAYSYPWYSLVEEDGPHPVMIGGAMTMGGMVKGAGGAEGTHTINLNQCRWVVLDANDAAARLLALDDEVRATGLPESKGSFYHRYQWPKSFFEKVLAAYADGPEFKVKHGHWPEFRLHIGRSTSHAQRGYAMDKSKSYDPSTMTSVGSVFDTNRLCLNHEIGAVITHGRHPKEALQRAQEKVASGNDYAGIDKLMIEQQLASLEKDVAEYEACPESFDFVELHYDDWMLSRSGSPN